MSWVSVRAKPASARTSKAPKAIYDAALWRRATIDSLQKFDPRTQVRNPVMFVVWLGAVVTAALTINPALFGPSDASATYNGVVTVILLSTVWFANFAEALAECRGKVKAASLRRTKEELTATRVNPSGGTEAVLASALRKGDVVRIERNEAIPADGDVVEGVAFVNELAITGESAPVLKQPGTDMFSTVTAGTLLISDRLVVRVAADPGESFLDRMIHLVEGAKRQKTPNELALTALLAILTLIFLIVVSAMAPVAAYLHARINVADLVALLVALIPTTIGALLSAIGIAGIDRTFRFNMLAMSGKAVEAAGDVHTLLLDKTGTITVGDRQATEFLPLAGCTANELIRWLISASCFDTTPEGRTIITLGERLGATRELLPDGARPCDFSAETRMSGVDLPDGQVIRKGAASAVVGHVLERFGGVAPPDLWSTVEQVSMRGGTPLVVAVGARILGVVALSDVLKSGIRDRMLRMREMGIRTVMVTGDNPVTAGAIASQAGVDDFVAEAKPEEKLNLIRREQAQGRLVAMTGDGTNDAPALAQADVGVAMHSGTNAAKEAANLIDLILTRPSSSTSSASASRC